MIIIDKLKAFKAFPKEVWIGWISSSVEAYNMVIYSFIAPLLAPLLFQQTTARNTVFFSYSLVLLGSSLLYPAGAIYYGLIGDRYGRQKICIYSTLGLAIATGLMGLIPIHLLKDGWIYFLVLIGAQHFFSGGEYHGSIVFSLEHSERKQNGLMSSLSCLFAVFGLVFANGLATLSLVMRDEFWIRACFFVGAAGGLISYVLKKCCQETPAFCTLNQTLLKEVKWFAFIRQEWSKVVSVVSVLAFFIVSYNFIFIFLPLINIEANTEDFSTFKSLIAYGVLLILSGLLADKMGMQKTILTGICLFSIVIIPLTFLCRNLLVLQMVLTACACLVIGPIHSWMLHQFSVSQRCRGIFISSAIATSVFGGSTVPICLMIFEKSHSLVMCSLYPLIITISTLGCLICMRQSKRALV
ncbi:MAG: MFS transporter [Candidatus Neptunochlamydia sp.]|nr:MFS transporter [Candidatus Neptunochlamydia sp.]